MKTKIGDIILYGIIILLVIAVVMTLLSSTVDPRIPTIQGILQPYHTQVTSGLTFQEVTVGGRACIIVHNSATDIKDVTLLAMDCDWSTKIP